MSRRSRAADKELWTVRQAAKWLGVTEAAVYWRAKEGTLPGLRRFGRLLRIVRSELQASVLGADPEREAG